MLEERLGSKIPVKNTRNDINISSSKYNNLRPIPVLMPFLIAYSLFSHPVPLGVMEKASHQPHYTSVVVAEEKPAVVATQGKLTLKGMENLYEELSLRKTPFEVSPQKDAEMTPHNAYSMGSSVASPVASPVTLPVTLPVTSQETMPYESIDAKLTLRPKELLNEPITDIPDVPYGHFKVVFDKKTEGSKLEGHAELVWNLGQEKGINPYFAAAVMFQESGNGKSKLIREKNNVAGFRRKNEYIAFASVEESIAFFYNCINKHYVGKGLTTPKTINPKYCETASWADKVTTIMAKLYKDSVKV